MDAEYMLIHSVDPTKIKVNVKDKFAKLTLSSNKKKQEMDNLKDVNDQPNKRISRNLLDDFGMKDSTNKFTDKDDYVNPILRSDSSSICGSHKEISEPDDIILNELNVEFEKSTQMEPLQISDDSIFNTQTANDDCLMQKLSELRLSNQLDSDKNINEKKLENLPDKKNISEIDAEITVISTSDENESNHAITISDTSQSEIFEIATSNIPQSGETADAFLPSTFSNDKADRIEAFLRDVSQEQKYQESKSEYKSETLFEDKPWRNSPIRYANEKIRIKNMATAETESMSQDYSEFGKNKSQLNINDTVPMTQSITFTECNSQGTQMNKDMHVDEISYGMRLAHNDTIANTTISNKKCMNCSDSESIINQSINLDSFESDHQQASLLPDESITISETSSEDEVCQDIPQTASNEIKADNESHSVSSCSDTSESQSGVASVNISAKINIKIQVSHQISEENSLEESLTNFNNSKSDPLDELTNCSISDEEVLQTSLREGDSSNNNVSENKSKDDETFAEHAQKLLNKLYGKSWQTPEVLRTLHRTMNDSKKQIELDINKQRSEVNTKANDSAENVPEESVLDDFSIFRRNIKTTLDSTRNVECTPTRTKQKAKQLKSCNDKNKEHFKVPQVDVKKRNIPRKCAAFNERWRDLIDDSKESILISSDDEDANKTNDDSTYSESSDKKSVSSNSSDESDNGVRKKSTVKKQTTKTKSRKTKKDSKLSNRSTKLKNNKLVYLDLSKEEIEIIEGTPGTPQANNDENFKNRLQSILGSCKFEGKPILPATPKTIKKRKLFTPKFGSDEELPGPSIDENKEIIEKENVSLNCHPMPAKFEPFNKQLEAVRTGNPIFKIQSPRSKEKTIAQPDIKNSPSQNSPFLKIPGEKKSKGQQKYSESISPKDKYGFLKSLDVCVAKSVCHPDALYYRDNYRQKKEELSQKLYMLYNEKLFNNELDVPILWNKKLLNTAGRCLNKKKLGIRSSVVELSEKVLTSADRLRCTLIHELCHAASWIFNGEGGHGATWKSWAHKANATFPEIPKIGVCHQYEIEYKYTYKCTLCAAKSHAHSKSKKVENIRCSYCHGAIEVFLNKKDKDGNIIPTPVKEPTGFAKFVKDKYREYKRPDLKHADIMKKLSNEFSAMKVANAN